MDNFKKPLTLTNYDLNTKTYDMSTKQEMSFKELGNVAVGGSFEGHFGMLITDQETALYKKSYSNNLLLTILTCSVSSAMFYVVLLKGCDATDIELYEFQEGMRERYSEITVNNIRVFNDDQIEINMQAYLFYLHTYLQEWGKEDDDTVNLLNGGTKASDWIVTELFKRYHLENDLSEIEIILEQQKAGIDVSLFSYSLQEVIRHEIKRNI
jgi:hypothetical protein